MQWLIVVLLDIPRRHVRLLPIGCEPPVPISSPGASRGHRGIAPPVHLAMPRGTFYAFLLFGTSADLVFGGKGRAGPLFGRQGHLPAPYGGPLGRLDRHVGVGGPQKLARFPTNPATESCIGTQRTRWHPSRCDPDSFCRLNNFGLTLPHFWQPISVSSHAAVVVFFAPARPPARPPPPVVVVVVVVVPKCPHFLFGIVPNRADT